MHRWYLCHQCELNEPHVEQHDTDDPGLNSEQGYFENLTLVGMRKLRQLDVIRLSGYVMVSGIA